MSDETKKVETDAADEGVEYENTLEEFMALSEQVDATEKRLVRASQGFPPEVALGMRTLVGEIMPLLQTVVQASGGAFASLEQAVLPEGEESEDEDEGEDDDDGLSYEDARDLYRCFVATISVLEASLDAAQGASEVGGEVTRLETLLAMNRTLMNRLPEMSGMSLDELRKAADEPDETEDEEEEDDGEDEEEGTPGVH